MNTANSSELNRFFEQHGIRDVECIFADISGYPRGKLMPASAFAAGNELRIAQAIPMQAVTGDYSDDAIFPQSDPDLRLVPDYSTLKRSPWSSVPRAMAIHDCIELDGTPCVFAGRSLLKTVLARYQAQGLTPVVAPEIEFYLTAPNTDPNQALLPPAARNGRMEAGQSAFSLNMLNELAPFWDAFRSALDTLGVRADTWIHEVGPTQYEINLQHGNALAAADQAFLFKYAAKEVAIQHGLNAVFMAKPIAGAAGSSMHLHLSVLDTSGHNIFSKEDGTEKATMSLLKGGIRAVTGVIGHQNQDNLKINAVVATIGIRGTGFNLNYCLGNCQNIDRSLAKDGLYAGVFEGKISLRNEAATDIVGTNQFYYVADRNTPPTKLLQPPNFLPDPLTAAVVLTRLPPMPRKSPTC